MPNLKLLTSTVSTSVKVNILRGLDKSVELVNVRRQPCSSRHKHSTGVYLLHYMCILALYSTSIKQCQSLNRLQIWNMLWCALILWHKYDVNICSVMDTGQRFVASYASARPDCQAEALCFLYVRSSIRSSFEKQTNRFWRQLASGPWAKGMNRSTLDDKRWNFETLMGCGNFSVRKASWNIRSKGLCCYFRSSFSLTVISYKEITFW